MITTPDDAVAQGLHRQRRRGTPSSPWSSPSSRSAAKSEGVHAFVVPIREDGEVLPGVRIEDDGRKMGLNGVDNGRIWFDGVRVPRDRAAQPVRRRHRRTGVYESAIDNPNRRFFTMLGTLVQGRVCVGGAGINAAKVALDDRHRSTPTAAPPVRGDLARTQEELLLDYGMHQRRLFPLLARTYALHFAQEVVAGQLHEVFSRRADAERPRRRRRELESRAAGTKALGTWHATRTIQECREACGGAGYLVGEPVRRAQGRHRRVHDVRGRQPRAAAAGRQGPAHRLRQRLRGPRPVRDGPVRRRPRRSRP